MMMKLFSIAFILIFNSILSIGQVLNPTETMAMVSTYVVYTNTGDTLPDRVLSYISDSTGQVFSGTTGKEGVFRVLLPEGDTYSIEYRNILGNLKKGKLSIPSMDGVINQGFNIALTLEKNAKNITLDNIYFDSGSSNLKPESDVTLNSFVAGMKFIPSLVVEIQGHTDSDGDDDLNMKLSQDRADAVKTYVVLKGISADRMVTKGFGETVPVAGNDTNEGKQKNRRTEVKILSQ